MASSNYPAERTIPVTSKGSIPPPYPENKTASLKFTGTAIAYPPHKTFSVPLKKTAFKPADSTAPAQKKEMPASNYSSPKITRVILKMDPVPSASGRLKEITSSNYPLQKTTKVSLQPVPVPGIGPEREIRNYPQHKTVPVTLKTGIAAGAAAAGTGQAMEKKAIRTEKIPASPSASQKKPAGLLLIIACALFALTAGVLSWMYWQQTRQMDLLLADQQKLEEITGLKVDDIVGGGLKNNDEFAQTSNTISEIKYLRICFTANGGQNSQAGQKTFFVRIVNPDNTPVLLSESPAIKVNGKKVECTFSKEVNYENGELFACRDIEKPEDLSAGIYKIEIYSNGALKGEGSFELK